MTRRALCKLDALDDGVPFLADADGTELVVVRCGAELYCLENVCSHEDFPLSDGEVDTASCEIECARHGSMFDLATGEPRSLPATRPVRTYPVHVEDGAVVVELG